MNTTAFQPNVQAQNANYAQQNAIASGLQQPPNWSQQLNNPQGNIPYQSLGQTTANVVPIQQSQFGSQLKQGFEQGALQGSGASQATQGLTQGAQGLGNSVGAGVKSLFA